MNQTKYTFLLPAYKTDFFEEALRIIKQIYMSRKNISQETLGGLDKIL